MKLREIELFDTLFEGVEIIIPNAKFFECPCGEKMYSAKELRRWKRIKEGLCSGTVS